MIEPRRPFQFTLRTLLLLFVVAASSMAVFGAWGILVFLLTVGLAAYIRDVSPLWPLAALVLLTLCMMCLWPAINSSREAGRRASCLNNMKQIGLALQNYHSANGAFPPVCTVDKSGKPLHSWRTLILPYMEYDFLYKSMDLTKPWDSPKNKLAATTQLREYVCPSDPSSGVSGTAQTNYFAVVGPGTAWDRTRPFAPSDKEACHTIMVVEVANSGVAWAEPKDVSLDAPTTSGSNSSGLFPSSKHVGPQDFFYTYDFRSPVCVTMADGSVQCIRLDHRSPDELRRLFQIGGCTEESLGPDNDVYATRRLNWPNIAALAVWLVSVVTLLTAAVRSRKLKSVR